MFLYFLNELQYYYPLKAFLKWMEMFMLSCGSHQSNQTQWEIYRFASVACKLNCKEWLILQYLRLFFIRFVLTSQPMKLGMFFLYFTTYCMSWNSVIINFYEKMSSSMKDRDKTSEQSYLTGSRCCHIRHATKYVCVQFSQKNSIFFRLIPLVWPSDLTFRTNRCLKTASLIYMADRRPLEFTGCRL